MNDLNWVRPGGGIPSKETNNIIGKKLKEDLVEGQKSRLIILNKIYENNGSIICVE